jgi:homoserine O-succinyltransferase/O-acetyltransferase
MPVVINPSSPDHHLYARAGREGVETAPEECANLIDWVDIGLINNMPDSALIPTERQLFDLLSAAADKNFVRLHLFSIDATPRSSWGRDYVKRFYRPIHNLLESDLDGIIVTGAEPTTDRLTDEPYWKSFVRIVDWAKENTVSSVFSCLAVHGAVQHLDGIERHPLGDKCIGVFNQTKLVRHPLMMGVPERLRIPHSRWNEVREGDLIKSGYSVLTKSEQVGVDCFIKQQEQSLFVYFQGHPEYEAQSLLGEYRRDIGRFLRRENERYPNMPQGYFSISAEEAVATFKREALSGRRPELLAKFPVDRLAHDLKSSWHTAAKCIYRNWIMYLGSHMAGPMQTIDGLNFSLTATG